MTDKNEKALTENTDNSADESSLNSPKEDTSNATQPAPHNESKASNTLPAAALFVGVVAIGLSGWQYYQSHIVNNHQSTITATENKVVALEQQLSRIDRNVENNTQLTRRISDINDTVTATQAEAKALQSHTEQALIDISSKINKLSNADKNDWLLAEAEYLIRLANQRLLLDKDTRSAISLLSNADTILASLEDPLMFATRKAVAQDIQALKSVTSFDIEGRYLQLSALYDQVATLPQREPSKAWLAQQASAEAAPDQTSSSVIKQLLQEAWQGIKSLVVINYDQKPIKPLLPPAEYQELVTGIQLQLDVAQVALLKGEPVIYEKSLERIAKAVNQHFDTSAQSTIAFMTTLTSLQQVNPNPDVPMPRASLQAMKSLMQNWQRSDNEPTTPATQDQEDKTSDAVATSATEDASL